MCPDAEFSPKADDAETLEYCACEAIVFAKMTRYASQDTGPLSAAAAYHDRKLDARLFKKDHPAKCRQECSVLDNG